MVKLPEKIVVPAMCFLLVMLPYWPAVNFNFLMEWDDGGFILKNPYIALTGSNVWNNLTSTLQHVYTPVMTLSLMVDHWLFGLNPAGYHLHNILIYGAAGVFLYMIMRELNIPMTMAVFFTVMWAWNPARVESVAWIAERKAVLSGALAFAAFWLFLRSYRLGKTSIAAGVLLFLAMLAKPWVLPGLGVMIVYAFCKRPEAWKYNCKILAAPAVGGVLGITLSLYMTLSDLTGTGTPNSIIICGINFLRYVGNSVLPVDLNPIHPTFYDDHLFGQALIGVAVILLALVLINIGKTPYRIIIGFSLIAAGLVLPVLNSGEFTNSDYADRYSFFVSAAVWIFLAVMIRYARHRMEIVYKASFAVIAVLGCYYFYLISMYLPVFTNSETLFRYACETEVPNSKAIEGLGLTGKNKQKPELLKLAGNYFIERSGIISPRRREINFNSGLMFINLAAIYEGDNENADEYFKTLCHDDKLPEVYSKELFMPEIILYRATRLLRQGDVPGATGLLDTMTRQKYGTEYDLLFAEGLSLYLKNDHPGALRSWKKAQVLRPDDPNLAYNIQKIETKGP